MATAIKEVPVSEVVTISAELAVPWPDLNPRRRFDPERQAELEASIRAEGLLEPVLVAPPLDGKAAAKEWTGKYWVVAGERRWRACLETGTPLVAVVRSLTFRQALLIALSENLQRADMTVIEEARGFKMALDDGMSQKELAGKLGLKQPTISNRVRLLALPEEILGLMDEGRIQPSHARDFLLPFTTIPTAKQKKLWKRFLKVLNEETRPREDLEWVIGNIAKDLSRPIAGGYGDDAPLFAAKEHKACTCGGPKFKYDSWRAEVRCFDDGWWKSAQAAAKKKVDEAEKARLEKLRALGSSGPAPVMDYQEFHKKYGWGEHERLEIAKDHSAYGRPVLLDPAELADATAIVVKGPGGGREVHCVDMAAVKRAKSAATKERNRLLAERRQARADADRKAAAETELEPWMLAAILHSRPLGDTLLEVGRELELDVGKHGEVYQKVESLPAEDVTLLFKVLALRHRRGELSWNDPLEKAVDSELVRRYAPGLAAIRRRALNVAEDEEPSAESTEAAVAEAECIVCGCSDSEACPIGCSWLVVDRDEGIGVCSSCAETEDEAKAMLAEELVA